MTPFPSETSALTEAPQVPAKGMVSMTNLSRAIASIMRAPKGQRLKAHTGVGKPDDAGFQLIRGSRVRATNTIGLVMPIGHETGQKTIDPFLLQMIGHLTEEVVPRGYDLLFSKMPAPTEGWLDNLIRSNRFDGLLMIGQSDQHNDANRIGQNYIPMVVWGERLPGQSYCTVGVDNVFGGRIATEHLMGLGRRQIRFVGPVDVPEVESRYRGYLQGMTQMPGPRPITKPIVSSFAASSAYEALHEAMRAGEIFDGLFCASDVIADGARRALMEARLKVPEDVALVGFDDVPMAQNMSPPLTSVRQDMGLAAKTMVELLFRRMQGEITPSNIIPARLVVRESSAGARPRVA
jgi:DNA-binding LacI/PurR family transcriptional regulator